MAVVLKEHATNDSAAFEARTLLALQPYVNVPKLISFTSNNLIIEYIDGTIAIDYILQCNSEKVVELARQMFEFCKSYSDIMHPYYLSDTNFRNFIVVENCGEMKLYGVDFEDNDIGSVLNSSAKLCAFVFLYDIERDKKKLFYNTILSELLNINHDKHTFDCELIK